MGTSLPTSTQTAPSMNTLILACSVLASAAAGPILVNVNGVFLPQHHSSSPYPTAYGYAAGPQHALHQVAAVEVSPVSPVAAIQAVPAPVHAVPTAVVKAVPVAPA